MFNWLGSFAVRYRVPIIVVWVLAAVVITVASPGIEKVASSDSADFLPDDAPFHEAERIVREAFPDRTSRSSAVVVMDAGDGGSLFDETNWQYVEAFTQWANGPEAPDNIVSVISPASGSSIVADLLVADDEQVAMLLVRFNTSQSDERTIEALDELHTHLADTRPAEMATYITGEAAIIGGYVEATQTSVDRTLWITLVLVITMLLIVYRSPVSPLVPLLSVTVVYFISQDIIGWLGESVWTISSFTNMFLIVVLFGAGTDYCLFLISRFREELGHAEPRTATRHTVDRVGETITSSAGTVIVGFVAMSFAEMGLFNTSGPSLAIGVLVMLAAGLTLTPALLSLLGERAFWPLKVRRNDGEAASPVHEHGLYAWISIKVSERPVAAVVLIVLVLSPFVVYGIGQPLTYDMLEDMPDDYDARQGFYVLDEHIGGGQMQPLTVAITDLGQLDVEALNEIGALTADLLAVPGVADVRSLTRPVGESDSLLADVLRVDRQLALAADMLDMFGGEGEEAVSPLEMVQMASQTLPAVTAYFDGLAAAYPQITDDPDLAAVRELLDVQALGASLAGGTLQEDLEDAQDHLTALAETFATMDSPAYYLPSELPEALTAQIAGGEEDPVGMLQSLYLSSDGSAARFDVVLENNPYSDGAMDSVLAIRDLLEARGNGAVSGTSSIITDMRDTMNRDMVRSFALVLLGVFVVLLFLLRALVSPVYLILTILFSYGATFGVTRLLFEAILGVEGLSWFVPFFMFVLLVALGMDYNIFLMGRVKEEVSKHGIREGVHRAVAATGSIITSAGVIMAGTFAAMMSADIQGLVQIGFAVAFGVLLDTFVIRTALVPAITVILGRWSWWPGAAPGSPRAVGRRPLHDPTGD
jgi:RND superfamily putative drug exporter